MADPMYAQVSEPIVTECSDKKSNPSDDSDRLQVLQTYGTQRHQKNESVAPKSLLELEKLRIEDELARVGRHHCSHEVIGIPFGSTFATIPPPYGINCTSRVGDDANPRSSTRTEPSRDKKSVDTPVSNVCDEKNEQNKAHFAKLEKPNPQLACKKICNTITKDALAEVTSTEKQSGMVKDQNLDQIQRIRQRHLLPSTTPTPTTEQSIKQLTQQIWGNVISSVALEASKKRLNMDKNPTLNEQKINLHSHAPSISIKAEAMTDIKTPQSKSRVVEDMYTTSAKAIDIRAVQSTGYNTLNHVLVCELKLFLANILAGASSNYGGPELNVSPNVLERADIAARSLVREHQRTLCDAEAEARRLVTRKTTRSSKEAYSSPSQTDIANDAMCNPFCRDATKSEDKSFWNKICGVFPMHSDSNRDCESLSKREFATEVQKLHTLYCRGLNAINVESSENQCIYKVHKILEYFDFLRFKNHPYPCLIVTNACDLWLWDSVLQNCKTAAYYPLFGDANVQDKLFQLLSKSSHSTKDKIRIVLTTYDDLRTELNMIWHVIVFDSILCTFGAAEFHQTWCKLMGMTSRQRILLCCDKISVDVRLLIHFTLPAIFYSRSRVIVWNCAAFDIKSIRCLLNEVAKLSIGQGVSAFHTIVEAATLSNSEKEAKLLSTMGNHGFVVKQENAFSREHDDFSNRPRSFKMHKPDLKSSRDARDLPLGSANVFISKSSFNPTPPIFSDLPSSPLLPLKKSPTSFSGRSNSNPSRKRISRCGNCVGCLSEDCMLCGHCKDMKKYGGPGLRKQSCKKRKCLNPRSGHLTLEKQFRPQGFLINNDDDPSAKEDEFEFAERNMREEELALGASSQDSDHESMTDVIADSSGSNYSSSMTLPTIPGPDSSYTQKETTMESNERMLHSPDQNEDTSGDSYLHNRAGNSNKHTRTRVMRCGKCTGCRAPDCLMCRHCLDMKKYGGPGLRKQSCKNRKCVAPKVVLLNQARDDEILGENGRELLRGEDDHASQSGLFSQFEGQTALHHRLVRDNLEHLSLTQMCELLLDDRLVFPCSSCVACFSSTKQLTLHEEMEHSTSTNMPDQWTRLACRKLLQPAMQYRLIQPMIQEEPVAFAKLEGPNIRFYILQPVIVLGRMSDKWIQFYRNLDVQLLNGLSGGDVDCHIGGDSAISQNHALLFYSHTQKSFFIQCLDRQKPILVNSKQIHYLSPPVKLHSRTHIQIASTSQYFLLPRQLGSYKQSFPKEQLHHFLTDVKQTTSNAIESVL